jgi:hypothetical protein
MCNSNCKRRFLRMRAVVHQPYFHEDEIHNAHHAVVFHAQEMSRRTYAGNDGEKLTAREKPSAHNDPVSSDFKVTERSRRVR